MRVVRSGHRVLFEPAARAYDVASTTARQESVRKIRTIAGTFQLFAREPWLLSPVRNPLWFETISHKGLRLLTPALQMAALVLNVALAADSPFRELLLMQTLFYAAALGGYALRQTRRSLFFLTVPYTVCLLSYTTIAGFAAFVARRQQATWDRVGAAEKRVVHS
jgi:hypothetical protein